MVIYGVSLSPYVRKTLVFATEKGLVFDTQDAGPASLGPSPPEFYETSPFHKVPSIRDGTFTLSDSTAIVFYLDDIRKENNLIPTAFPARARTVWFDEFSDTIIAPCARTLFFNRVAAPWMGRIGDHDAADRAQATEVPRILAYLERVIPPSGFLVEDRLTLADLAVASPIVNLYHGDCPIDAQAYPKTFAYVTALHARPSFRDLIAKEKKLLEEKALQNGFLPFDG
jgi:glutathione S-transferase